jgi:ribosomal protein L35
MWSKIKTNKSMAKRIKVTKSWKLMHKKWHVSHLLTNKSDMTKACRWGKEISKADSKRVKNLLPYSI